MKARILPVFALLCAFVCTARGPAWAQTSVGTLSGLYACAGTGVTSRGSIGFTFEGILDFANSPAGSTITSPAGSGWVWDIAGFSTISIAVTNGDYSAGETGQGDLVLEFSGGLPAPLPNVFVFDNQVVMSDIDSSGIAHTFVMTFIPPTSGIKHVQVTVCQAENQAKGNPLPPAPPTP
jgi:hypothetical protein